jgi:Wiskott-Aldrich syndrome protein
VEAAKARYKAEKERYRREREERKKRQQNVSDETDNDAGKVPMEAHESSTGVSRAREEPMSHLVSNARGSFPQLEMVSVPRRHHTYSGPQRPLPGFPIDRTSQRVSRRLADMGFTENAYPTLPAKIRDQIPQNGNLSKDAEDDVVTTLLEDLLAMSPKPPLTSGSVLQRDRDLPGAWD